MSGLSVSYLLINIILLIEKASYTYTQIRKKSFELW